MVKPSILPEGGKKEASKEAKGTEASLPAFAVIPLGTDLPPKYDDCTVEAAPIPVVNRPRKLGVCLCVSMLLTLLLIIGLAVVMFLGHASGKYQFRCGVGYGDYKDYPSSHEDRGTLEEEVEVDPFEGYEQIEIPEQDYCERLTILHDFTVNMTAYRLRRSQVCYVTFLDKEIVMGPDEFIERAEENPQFLTDHYETVHETYRVVLPELTPTSLNSGRFGFYIPMLCDGVESYWIEKIPEDELEAWEAYWASQDQEDSESREDGHDQDDDDDFELPNPEHRRRRAVGGASDVKEFLAFEGHKLSKFKIYTKEAVEAFKKASNKN
ncbi:uncharacterized protein LOC119725543 [Patiria miniata]|uniref:Integral membrane protein 2 n=1 Tax=Patiria miniata TaxID=46514 RepID=A0A913ZM75_PATMI|nr:uncharacterized protein LOC119725543 [Patiria miniata]